MNIDKKQLKTAKNYANALFKIGLEQNDVESLYSQFKNIVEIINNSSELKSFLENPLVSHNDKKEIIYKVFGKNFDLQLINLMNVLADNKRFSALETIFYCFEKKYEQKNDISRIEIISATEMNDETKDRLIKVLNKKLGRQIIPNYLVNQDIIGGLIIKISDKIIDLSLNKKIKDMERQII